MKKWMLSILVMVCLLSLIGSALAGTLIQDNTPKSYSSVDDGVIPEFLFYHFKKGIGCGNCPVYSAPSMEAYRANNGNAVIDTFHDMFIGGFTETRWLMVRYETNKGKSRVGYIPPQYVRNFNCWERVKFSYVERVAEEELYVAESPLQGYTYFAKLDAGEQYHILGDYNYVGDWWYIEFMVDGQVARGFIEK